MAADRAKTGLMIALIIFVMITFILAVTTYIGFQQRSDEQEVAKTARKQMEDANSERDAAVQQVKDLGKVVGETLTSFDEVMSTKDAYFNERFTEFQGESKDLVALIDWLDKTIKAKDAQLATAAADVKQANAKADAAADKLKTCEEQVKAAKEAADEQVRKATTDFAARWAQHEKSQQDLKAKQSDALVKAEQMRAITEELAKLGPLLSPERRRKYESPPPPGQPEPWPERVRSVFLELKDLQRAVAQLNATLAKLGVADARVQELVRDAAPQDQRIDGFDGRVAVVNARDRTVLISCDSTAGMRPGLVFAVYDPDDPRPQVGRRKGMVEVVEVESPALARARILEDSASAPILAGDGVASSLWAPDADQEIVIVGYVRFGTGGTDDATTLAAVAKRHGARVVDTVSPQTVLIVDAGLPRPGDADASGKVRGWKTADETVRKNALARARELGVRVVPLDGLLDMLGLDREMLDGRRLPTEIGAAP